MAAFFGLWVYAILMAIIAIFVWYTFIYCHSCAQKKKKKQKQRQAKLKQKYRSRRESEESHVEYFTLPTYTQSTVSIKDYGRKGPSIRQPQVKSRY